MTNESAFIPACHLSIAAEYLGIIAGCVLATAYDAAIGIDPQSVEQSIPDQLYVGIARNFI